MVGFIEKVIEQFSNYLALWSDGSITLYEKSLLILSTGLSIMIVLLSTILTLGDKMSDLTEKIRRDNEANI